MKLTKEVTDFLEEAKGEKDASTREGILLSPKHKSIIATDGYRLHAVRNSNNTIACVVEFKDGLPFILNNYEEYPPLEKVTSDEYFDVVANVFVNSSFLLDALQHADGMIRLEVLKRKADKESNTTDAVQIFSYVGGVPAYALIMGMQQTGQDEQAGELAWKPRTEEVKS